MTTFETFRQIGNYVIRDLTDKEPSCFNGVVRVTKQRITIEEIKEPTEIIQARIQKLWDECNNHHHRDPLRAMASKYDMDLK